MTVTLKYDQTSDSLYIRLTEEPERASRTEQIDEGTLVDLDAHGNVLGIEVLRPGRAWPLEAILGKFPIPTEDADLLRALWEEQKPYPFAQPSSLAGVG